MLTYTNLERTAAQFNGAFFSLAAPEDFTSIGDGPTREAVLTWLEEGSVPEDYAAPDDTVTKARAYLASTDWYIVRLFEKSVPVPQDVLDARQAARDSIV